MPAYNRTLTLMRHSIFNKNTDSIFPKGIELAQEAGNKYVNLIGTEEPVTIAHTPVKRGKETAEIIAGRFKTRPALKEIKSLSLMNASDLIKKIYTEFHECSGHILCVTHEANLSVIPLIFNINEKLVPQMHCQGVHIRLGFGENWSDINKKSIASFCKASPDNVVKFTV